MDGRMRTPTLATRTVDRRAADRRRNSERRRRREPVAVERRWPYDRRHGDRRDSLMSRLLRYVG